jgi:hypothetical protein
MRRVAARVDSNMVFAPDASGKPARAGYSGQLAVCPGCRGEVVAKCGDVKLWHRAHLVADCDPWTQPEKAWYVNSKIATRFPMRSAREYCAIGDRGVLLERYRLARVVPLDQPTFL